MFLSIETTITSSALGIMVSCDRVLDVKTLWIESGLRVPLTSKEENLPLFGTLVHSARRQRAKAPESTDT